MLLAVPAGATCASWPLVTSKPTVVGRFSGVVTGTLGSDVVQGVAIVDPDVWPRAAPVLGKRFLSWGGACSGTSPVCRLPIKANASVQANFAKSAAEAQPPKVTA